jgi:hypothetical protein
MGLYSQRREVYLPPSSPKYGQKIVKGRIVHDAKEQKLIKLILEKNDQGWSLRQIAVFLEGLGIRTKKGNKKWAANTIRKIILDNKPEAPRQP